jgi:serine/threonine-protein kinase ULK/ATG1
MAPEVLFGNSYDLKADIWSIGVIYYELLYGVCPFETNNIVNLISKINQGLVNFPHHV